MNILKLACSDSESNSDKEPCRSKINNRDLTPYSAEQETRPQLRSAEMAGAHPKRPDPNNRVKDPEDNLSRENMRARLIKQERKHRASTHFIRRLEEGFDVKKNRSNRGMPGNN